MKSKYKHNSTSNDKNETNIRLYLTKYIMLTAVRAILPPKVLPILYGFWKTSVKCLWQQERQSASREGHGTEDNEGQRLPLGALFMREKDFA